MVGRQPGLLLEDKGAALALHFQGQHARDRENQLRAEVAMMAAPLVPEFTLLDGHAVIEIKPAVHTKDSAVSAFMLEAPFGGRTPIFIGDDQTDYGGFAAVRRFDGLAIAVGPRVKSEWWLPGPAAVRQWLERLADSPSLTVSA
jgi:trehalose 6-phosphate phosphatase